MDKPDSVLGQIEEYYGGKVRAHGATPEGVDWNGEISQFVRFAQFRKLLDGEGVFSLNDLGCGYGALYGYLKSYFHQMCYWGFDLSEDMIAAAREIYVGESDSATFVQSSKPKTRSDYTVASGIFNVRFDVADDEWLQYIHQTLDQMAEYSQKGFAFNCLTSYADVDRMRKDLYYANPSSLFDFCKRRYSKNVALLHDYDLYEFTLFVRLSS